MTEYRVIVTDELQPTLAGHDGVSYQSLAAAARARARARPRADRARAAPGRARTVASGPARRHANRPNRAGAMTTTARPRQPLAAQALDSYLRMLAGPAPGARLLEIRFALRHRDMGRLFIAAHSAPGASRLIRRLAVSDRRLRRRVPAQPPRRRPRRDRPLAPRVRRDRHAGRPRPTPGLPASARRMIISSGSAGPRARVLRPVRAGHGARARASQPPPRARSRRRPRLSRRRTHSEAAVVVESQALAARASRARSNSSQSRRYDVDRLVDGLDDPPGRPPRCGTRAAEPARTEVDRLLLAIPAAEYVRVIAGVSPNRTGKIHCPFHDDHTPSLQLYEDGTWYCYGAVPGRRIHLRLRRARLADRHRRDRAFLRLRARLADTLGISAPG